MTNLRVGDLVVRNAKISPDAVALIEDDRVLTWSEFDRSTNRLADGLAAIGLVKNDRIATVIRNGAAAVQMIFSIAKAGMLAVPINYGLTAGEIEVLLDDSKPNAIIIDAEFVDNLAGILTRPGVTVVVRGEAAVPAGWLTYRSIEERGDENTVTVHIDPDEIRTIRYTSGTTAAPKGCLGTHRQILSSIDNFFSQIPVPNTGPFLQMLPLFSGAGIWMAIAAAYHGVANVLTREFDPQDALHKIEAHGVTHTCGVPTMMSRLADELRIGNYALRLLLITPRPCGIHMCANGACCSPTTTATRTLIRRSVSCANPANPTFGFRR